MKFGGDVLTTDKTIVFLVIYVKSRIISETNLQCINREKYEETSKKA